MLDLLARSWGWVLARGILLVIFGIFALAWPGMTFLALVIVFGAYALIDGIMALIAAANGGEGRGLLAFSGILGVLIGLMVFTWPDTSALALLILIAVWAIILGVDHIVKGFELRGDTGSRWLLVISGVFGVVLGFILILQPGMGIAALTMTLGAFAMAWGVVLVIMGFRLRQLKRTLT